MKLVKIAEYDDESQRLTYPEAVKAAKKAGCRLLTVEEWIHSGIKPKHALWCCSPSWLAKTKGGLLARGFNGIDYLIDYYLIRRSVYATYRPSDRFGVVGTPIKRVRK